MHLSEMDSLVKRAELEKIAREEVRKNLKSLFESDECSDFMGDAICEIERRVLTLVSERADEATAHQYSLYSHATDEHDPNELAYRVFNPATKRMLEEISVEHVTSEHEKRPDQQMFRFMEFWCDIQGETSEENTIDKSVLSSAKQHFGDTQVTAAGVAEFIELYETDLSPKTV